MAIDIVISFLRGLLINHDTPLTLHPPGRTLFAPEIDAPLVEAQKRDKPPILFGIVAKGKQGNMAEVEGGWGKAEDKVEIRSEKGEC